MTTDHVDPAPIRELKERFDFFAGEFFERLRTEWSSTGADPGQDAEKANRDVSSNADAIWRRAVFGEAPAACCERWSADLLAGNAEAIALTGHWLLVEAADANQFPNLLRPLGEAFYRWHPKSSQDEKTLEETLIRTLNEKAVALKLRNSIESVVPGDRFDANRHNPLPGHRGLVVDDVFGWVVMRDDRVFAKATVSLK